MLLHSINLLSIFKVITGRFSDEVKFTEGEAISLSQSDLQWFNQLYQQLYHSKGAEL